jgi:hypothetical protein
MAQSGTTIRTKLNQRVFVSPPGTSAIYYGVTISPATMGGYEGNTEVIGTGITTIVVPYGYISKEASYRSFGMENNGEMQVAIKHDVPVKIQDLFYITASDITSGTFRVTQVRPYPYDGVNLCSIVTVKRDLTQ